MIWKKLRFVLPAAALAVLATTAIVLWAQGPKIGLWETTMTMKWIQSPFPPGSPLANMPAFSGKPTTEMSCLTQEKLDKLQNPFAGRGGKDCQFSNLQKSDHGMSAEMVCTGRMNGKGNFEADWSDGTHAKLKSHFTGTIQARDGLKTIEWINEGTSVYKGPDCGAVKEE